MRGGEKMDRWKRQMLNRGNKRKQPMWSLLLLISIQQKLEETVSSLALIRAGLHASHTGSPR